ncbi:MAG: DUF1800 domain-containing protein [Chloroflexi bacterium]|nr:DUF1800 domain-containing protein [Chloroflexota bacterium]
MVTKEDISLFAHLMRRTGFGATRDEIETMAEDGYEATVEKLLDYESQEPVDDYTLYRYHPITEVPGGAAAPGQANWLYWMVNTKRPLQEKVALFWHHVFATGNSKVDNCNHLLDQIQMFRDEGMGNYRTLLVKLASDPAMIFWLDNNENHKHAPNENWGRELLELFSLGVGNYTEKDVYECSRAFTGWTIGAKMPRFPYGRFPWHFEFLAEDHDNTEKTFLGHTGNLDGNDIIDIILQQPACPKFICRHLYNFFVADEPQVPAWDIEEPRDPEAIQQMIDTFVDNDFEIKPVLRMMFKSDFFKAATYKKVKSPTEVVVGTLRLTGDMKGPDPRLEAVAKEPGYMGQDILDPPSVEGWHTGHEWINSGSLVKRVNFVADRISNTDLPGVKRIVERVAGSNGPMMSPEQFVDQCLDLMGPIEMADLTRTELISHAETDGDINWEGNENYEKSTERTGEMLALIGATREYQFG